MRWTTYIAVNCIVFAALCTAGYKVSHAQTSAGGGIRAEATAHPCASAREGAEDGARVKLAGIVPTEEQLSAVENNLIRLIDAGVMTQVQAEAWAIGFVNGFQNPGIDSVHTGQREYETCVKAFT